VWEELLEDFERGRLKKVYRPGTFDLTQSAVPRRDLLKGRYFVDSLQTSRGCPFDCEFCSVIVMIPEQAQAADVDGDGRIIAYDAALIAMRAIGLIDKFPVEED